eukprot:3544013-Rhodomonas_salina.1
MGGWVCDDTGGVAEHTYFEEWMTPERRDGRDGGNGGRAHKKGSLEKGEKGQNKRDDELKGASKGGQVSISSSVRFAVPGTCGHGAMPGADSASGAVRRRCG